MLRCMISTISTTFQRTKYFCSLYPSVVSCFMSQYGKLNGFELTGSFTAMYIWKMFVHLWSCQVSFMSYASSFFRWNAVPFFFFFFSPFLFFIAVCCTRYRFETILSVSDPIASYKLNNNEILGTGGSVGNKSGQRALWREKRWECQPEFKRRVPPYRESARLELSK